ncbi:MAG TPA: carboxymuconolactone decarboxylase family protein [Nitriliruptorales bacterium]
MSELAGPPRIRPGDRRSTGLAARTVARVVGLATGTNPPNLFTTLARHRRLFRPWLRFASRLMPGGALPRADSELVILRVAALTACDYERRHHERLAVAAGLTTDEIARTAAGPDSPGWSPRQAAILAAVDELHAGQQLADETWLQLESHLTEVELIELPMLVGHYVMLAMVLNGLRVTPDSPQPPATGPIDRLVAWAAARRIRS